jgi:hypothetical protein
MRRSVSFLLILLTLALFFNNAANWHFHKLPNGLIVEHAHPYAKFPSSDYPYQQHQHSDLEYLILDTIFHAAFIIVLLFAGLRLLLPAKPVARSVMPVHIVNNRYTAFPHLRGPPSVCRKISS